jgi:hypothetical protein
LFICETFVLIKDGLQSVCLTVLSNSFHFFEQLNHQLRPHLIYYFQSLLEQNVWRWIWYDVFWRWGIR